MFGFTGVGKGVREVEVGLLLLRGIWYGFLGWRSVAWFLLGLWCPLHSQKPFEIFPSSFSL